MRDVSAAPGAETASGPRAGSFSPAERPAGTPAWARRRWLLPVYIVALLGLSLAGMDRTLWTPDEPREAEIGREMFLKPTVIPTLDGERFYEKPPLYYWTVAAAFALAGGPSAAAARCVSAVAGFVTLLVVLAWGTRLRSRAVGVVASAVLATTAQFAVSTHWVLLDPLLMLFCAVATWAAWEAFASGGAVRPVLVLYACVVLTLWTKGPIGPVLIGAGLLAYCVVERRQRPWRALRPGLGIALLALALGALVAAIYLEGGRQALWEWGWVNQVQRFVNPQEKGHQQPIWYYLKTLPVAVLPWLVPVVGLFHPAAWRTAPDTAAPRRYLAAFCAGALVLLSLPATKRETYLLPLLPALATLTALQLEAWWLARPRGRLASAAVWAQASLLALVAVAPPVAVLAYTRAAQPATLATLAAAVAAAAALIVTLARRRLGGASVLAFACAAIGILGALVVVPAALEREKDFTPLVAWVDSRLPAGVPIAALGADETLQGIVPFLTGRRLVSLSADDVLSTPGRTSGRPALLLVQEGKEKRVDERLPRLYEMERAADIGPQRRLSLWRLAKGP
jgi:4-amino-4-deoxy-L-arabinose transferase-like glycosyltransferase